MKLVTLTSDFGAVSEGPGVMEATVLGICPEARVVHLSHEVLPFNVMDGARQMECTTTVPRGVHVCVVDPGVGTERKPVVVETGDGNLAVGPDNGVLVPLARRSGDWRCFEVASDEYMRHPVSSTFHGRDIFAAVAGHLAAGVAPSDVGPEVEAAHVVPAPYGEAVLDGATLRATVIHQNRFGSCILNVLEEEIRGVERFLLQRDGDRSVPVEARASFGRVARGQPLLYPDSYGRIGLALNQGSAAKEFALETGDPVLLTVCGD